jgi:ankyrin repeat protein
MVAIQSSAEQYSREFPSDIIERSHSERILNVKDNEEKTALHHATENGCLEAAKILLEIHRDVEHNAIDKHSWTPLHYAAQSNHANVVNLLLDSGAEINVRCPDMLISPLLAAVYDDSLDATKVLLRRGADFELSDHSKKTPLLAAAEQSHNEMLKLLLQNGANPHVKGMDGKSALHFAIWRGDVSSLEILLDAGVDCNAQDDEGHTPLHRALTDVNQNDMLQKVEYLVEKGADLNAQEKRGWTPLHIAAEQGRPTEVEFLLKGGQISASVRRRERRHFTLHVREKTKRR